MYIVATYTHITRSHTRIYTYIYIYVYNTYVYTCMALWVIELCLRAAPSLKLSAACQPPTSRRWCSSHLTPAGGWDTWRLMGPSKNL